MLVKHFAGSREVSTTGGLLEVLREASLHVVNEIWLSPSIDSYPQLATLISKRDAFVTFFPVAGHPGFQAIGIETASGTHLFFVNTPTEEIEIEERFVVGIEQAEQAAQEFFETQAMPTALRWIEL